MLLTVRTTYRKSSFTQPAQPVPLHYYEYAQDEIKEVVRNLRGQRKDVYVKFLKVRFQGDPYKTNVMFSGELQVSEVGAYFAFAGVFLIREGDPSKKGALAVEIVKVITDVLTMEKQRHIAAFQSIPS